MQIAIPDALPFVRLKSRKGADYTPGSYFSSMALVTVQCQSNGNIKREP